VFSWFTFFRFLHIFTAIIAFGPNFAFPLIGMMGGREPQHGNFALRVTAALEDRVVIPVALTMPVTGILMIVTGNLNLGQFWLLAGIALYVVAMVFAVVVQRGWVHQMIHLTEGRPGSAPALAAGPGALAAGPPPELLALRGKVQLGGVFLTLLLLAIVVLMVFRPGS
jgi:uncharacterized membrane protein